MKSAIFTRHVPKTVDEAVATLERLAPFDCRVLAGGQSLVPIMAFRMARPEHLVDINEVQGLDRLGVIGDALTIGALVRHSGFHSPPPCGVLGRLLGTVVQHIAHYPIRMRGTFCGSLAHADPASEWCLTAMTLGATVVAKDARTERTVPIGEFLQGIMTTSLADNELLVEAQIPLLSDDVTFGFDEHSRRAGDFAMASALVAYRTVEGLMADVRIGVGGAEDRPRRISEAECALNGRVPTMGAFSEAAEVAAAFIEPLEDPKISQEYRRDLVRSVIRRAFERSLN